MRKPYFSAVLLFSTIFVYLSCAQADPDDFYNQLKKSNDFSPAKVEELKKKTYDQDRLKRVNEMNNEITQGNKRSSAGGESGGSFDNTPTIPRPRSSSGVGSANGPSASSPAKTSAPLKVNPEDFPEDINFGSVKAPASTPATVPAIAPAIPPKPKN